MYLERPIPVNSLLFSLKYLNADKLPNSVGRTPIVECINTRIRKKHNAVEIQYAKPSTVTANTKKNIILYH